MPQAESPKDHLTDYERAICYYTLPKVSFPISFGIIVAYAVCLAEAIAAIGIGLGIGSETWVNAGLVALAALVVFGIVVFFGRAVLNELRQRRALAQAHGVPDAAEDDDEIPDPFADHILLKHPFYKPGTLFACTEDDLTINYLVETSDNEAWWSIKTAQDEEVCRAKAIGGLPSFLYESGLPSRLTVQKDSEELAQISPKFSFTAPTVRIEPTTGAPYVIRNGGIYRNDHLVGRIYSLRNSLYLDIEQNEFSEAVLAYFVTVT